MLEISVKATKSGAYDVVVGCQSGRISEEERKALITKLQYPTPVPANPRLWVFDGYDWYEFDSLQIKGENEVVALGSNLHKDSYRHGFSLPSESDSRKAIIIASATKPTFDPAA